MNLLVTAIRPRSVVQPWPFTVGRCSICYLLEAQHFRGCLAFVKRLGILSAVHKVSIQYRTVVQLTHSPSGGFFGSPLGQWRHPRCASVCSRSILFSIVSLAAYLAWELFECDTSHPQVHPKRVAVVRSHLLNRSVCRVRPSFATLKKNL